MAVAQRPDWARVVSEAAGEKGFAVSDLAAALGLSERSLRDRLSGRTRPLTTEVVRLARLLDLPLERLTAGDGAPSGPDLELLTDRDRRVYRAAAGLDGGEPMPDRSAIQAYVERVLSGPWWERWGSGVTEVRVVDEGRGGPEAEPSGKTGRDEPEASPARSVADGIPAWHEAVIGGTGVTHVLHIPAWARRPLTVLHELAHVAAQPILWAQPHGPQFIRLWVDLVAEELGRVPATALRAALKAEGLGLASIVAVEAQLTRGREEVLRLLGMEDGDG